MGQQSQAKLPVLGSKRDAVALASLEHFSDQLELRVPLIQSYRLTLIFPYPTLEKGIIIIAHSLLQRQAHSLNRSGKRLSSLIRIFKIFRIL